MRSDVRVVWLSVVALAWAGCLIDRAPLEGSPPPRDDAHVAPDAAPTVDAFVEDGVDATIPAPDASGPDAFTFDGGPPDAGLCDSAGEMCCAGSCVGSLRCLTNDVCDVVLCGTTPGGPCCLDGTCPGSTTICVGGPGGTCQTCGGAGEPCCASATCDDPTTTSCDGSACVACGGTGQPCCDAGSECAPGSSCEEGRCFAPAGTLGGRCRFSFDPCDAWLRCDSGICQRCGGSGQPCCGLGDCMSSLRCEWGTCR